MNFVKVVDWLLIAQVRKQEVGGLGVQTPRERKIKEGIKKKIKKEKKERERISVPAA